MISKQYNNVSLTSKSTINMEYKKNGIFDVGTTEPSPFTALDKILFQRTINFKIVL